MHLMSKRVRCPLCPPWIHPHAPGKRIGKFNCCLAMRERRPTSALSYQRIDGAVLLPGGALAHEAADAAHNFGSTEGLHVEN